MLRAARWPTKKIVALLCYCYSEKVGDRKNAATWPHHQAMAAVQHRARKRTDWTRSLHSLSQKRGESGCGWGPSPPRFFKRPSRLPLGKRRRRPVGPDRPGSDSDFFLCLFFFCKKSKEQQKLTNAEKRGIERKARRERGMAETKNELGKSKFRSDRVHLSCVVLVSP